MSFEHADHPAVCAPAYTDAVSGSVQQAVTLTTARGAAIALEGYFGIAIVTYLVHAVLKDTDNRLRAPYPLGGFIVLFHGAGRGLSFW